MGAYAAAYVAAFSKAGALMSWLWVCTTVAPASMHGIASATISSGVTGTIGLRSLRVTPLSAASMMTGVCGMVAVSRLVQTRVTELLGCRYPIVQAPMGYIARAQLASAVSEAGGMGIIETSSGRLDEVREEIVKMRDLTDKPFGVNIAQLFVRDPSIVDFVVDQGVRFVTTSAGDPTKYTALLKDAGLTVFHVVPTLHAALKAVDAGVDGLVAEGGEGGGFKNPRDVSTMVLVPLVRSKVDVPIIAAGGIADGRSMAAALALGAEGVQMGTRMVSAAESPVHENYKRLIVDAAETDTVFLNRFARPGFRVLRTPYSEALEREDQVSLGELGGVLDLYFGGNLDAAFAFGGQVAGRIDSVRPVREILEDTMAECRDVLADWGKRVAD